MHRYLQEQERVIIECPGDLTGKVDAFLGFPPEPQELRAKRIGRLLMAGKRPLSLGRRFAAKRLQTSVCSAISKASSTSIPRYRTVLSNFV
jgi:hypothetical protein